MPFAAAHESVPGTKPTWLGGLTTSVHRGWADLAARSADFRNWPRPCGNADEERRWRIVFSLVFFRRRLTEMFFSYSAWSRQTFYAQVRLRSFHTAWTRNGLGR